MQVVVTIPFSFEEIAAMRQLMEAGLKTIGRPCARAFVVIDEKLEMAVKDAQTVLERAPMQPATPPDAGEPPRKHVNGNGAA